MPFLSFCLRGKMKKRAHKNMEDEIYLYLHGNELQPD